MPVYQVPPDTTQKEKVIGGLLDWTQFFWLLAGFASGMLTAFIVYYLTQSIPASGILAIFIFGLFVPFALVKKLEMPLFTYLMRKRALKKKTKKLINMRKDV